MWYYSPAKHSDLLILKFLRTSGESSDDWWKVILISLMNRQGLLFYLLLSKTKLVHWPKLWSGWVFICKLYIVFIYYFFKQIAHISKLNIMIARQKSNWQHKKNTNFLSSNSTEPANSFSFIKCNISTLKCVEMTRPLFYILSTYVCTYIITHFSTMFKPRKIHNFYSRCIKFGCLLLQLPGKYQINNRKELRKWKFLTVMSDRFLSAIVVV